VTSFFGREKELAFLSDKLDPTVRGRKGVVAFGLAGSGKTQLVLRFIQTFGNRYSAVIWINASSKEQAVKSFADTAEAINALWPTKDLPMTYYGNDPDRKVLLRLRSTIHSRWLLVIDSADDIDDINLSGLIPDCKHGSVVITSTRRSAAELLEAKGFHSLEIDSLDSASASQLLTSVSRDPKTPQLTSVPEQASSSEYESKKTVVQLSDEFPPDNDKIAAIANELYCIPLALEQAGALLRRRIVTLDNFLERYRSHYKTLMAQRFPGATHYDKGHSVIAVVSLLCSAVEAQSPDSARLMTMLAVLGPRKIHFDLLKLIPDVVVDVSEGSSIDDTLLRLNLSLLVDVCLVKVEVNQTKTEEFVSIHGLVCRWIVDTMLTNQQPNFSLVLGAVMRFIWPDCNR